MAGDGDAHQLKGSDEIAGKGSQRGRVGGDLHGAAYHFRSVERGLGTDVEVGGLWGTGERMALGAKLGVDR